MRNRTVNIDWEYHGKPDALLGSGANRSEQIMVYAGSIIGLLLFFYFHLRQTWDGIGGGIDCCINHR